MRTRRRNVVLFGVSLVALSVWLASSSSRLDGRSLRSGLDQYDYIESLHFDRGGKGEMVWGWSQMIRLEVPFRYRSSESRVEIRYQDRGVPPRTIGFQVLPGHYHFERPLPARGCVELIDCQNQVRFDQSPWPPEGPSTLDYYSECSSEIRCEN